MKQIKQPDGDDSFRSERTDSYSFNNKKAKKKQYHKFLLAILIIFAIIGLVFMGLFLTGKIGIIDKNTVNTTKAND